MECVKNVFHFARRIIRRFIHIWECFKVFQKYGMKEKFILLNTPEHGNLGDQAIAMAERIFLETYFPEIPVIEITGGWLRQDFNLFKFFIHKKDILMMTGGGFMGNLWMNEEQLVRDIIRGYPKNCIFFFPQTVYFEDSEEGHRELKKSQEIYQSHNKLYICLREDQSYELIKKQFPNMKNVYKFPDMVMLLSLKDTTFEREGVSICLRKDKEKTIDNNYKKKIISNLEEKSVRYKEITTVENCGVSCKEREKKVYQKLIEFQKSQLVITDRLHAMLFSVITGTPCIAFDNISRKVSGVYRWIKQLDYIEVVDEGTDINGLVDQCLERRIKGYDTNMISKHFDNMAKVIKDLL